MLLQIVNLKTDTASWQGHTATVTAVAVEGTTVVSGSMDHTIRVWDTQRGAVCKFREGQRGLDELEKAVAAMNSSVTTHNVSLASPTTTPVKPAAADEPPLSPHPDQLSPPPSAPPAHKKKWEPEDTSTAAFTILPREAY